MTAPIDVSAPTRSQPGFLLWVGVNPADRRRHAAEIIELAETLGELARELLPTAETFTALSLGESGPQTPRTEDLGALRQRLTALEVIAHTPLWSEAGVFDSAASPADGAPGPADQAVPLFEIDLSPRVRIDLPARRVVADGAEQRLTYKEFELLSHLVTSAGRVVSRSELLLSVWRSESVDSASRTIDVHVRRLREKLGLQNQIITVRGAGYRFARSEYVEVIEAAQAG
ncbi:Transcriptional regulatory protein, C terminal [Sanguibacter gelidistatuariae]|uniref:Transcriptional regulatory protein, C terminal n=1 Tax=Sanguibacter gelidistatuariae TaxID=1814289 RepID=A0A1G6GPC8_9MICO|nr:winged helix-turn-helix domain-containing protein [Sanguibacter gelidistatuariae]SDB83723.1 Transcriptional regulatory protein, C terminal [Sanguibacter gelidistatuariae]